jgi:hypothetical protein
MALLSTCPLTDELTAVKRAIGNQGLNGMTFPLSKNV